MFSGVKMQFAGSIRPLNGYIGPNQMERSHDPNNPYFEADVRNALIELKFASRGRP